MELGQKSINMFRSAMSKKYSYSFLVSGTNHPFTIKLPETISLDSTIDYEVALIRFETYNSIFNINSTNNNFKYFNGKVNKTIILTPGAYEVTDINTEIQRLMKLQGDVTTKVVEANSADTFNINLSVNTQTLKSVITLKNNYTVDFTIANSLRTVLGFGHVVINAASNTSDNIVMIQNFTSILINTDLCTGSYINNKSSQTLYSLASNPVATGTNISIVPNPPLYLPLNKAKLSFTDFTVSITDENLKPVSFNGENINIVLHLKSV